MKYLLDTPAMQALREFLRSRNTLIALDYDGTLAPIAPLPHLATLPDTTRALLVRIARHYPVIVLTGRSRRDALHLLAGVPVLEVIGSHGAEQPGSPIGRFLALVEQWRHQLADKLKTVAGTNIEDKKYSLAVHYRQSDDPASAHQSIRDAASELKGARIVGGKKVVNVVPEGAPDKGAALLAALDRLGCERAVFIGDDETDESAFAVAASAPIFTIRVGEDPASRAGHYLRSQKEIDALLEAMLE